jgi:hypothetical protein
MVKKKTKCGERRSSIWDFGPPWRDLIGKYLYRGDVSEKKPVEIWLFKTGLGQGLCPSEICYSVWVSGLTK